AVADLLWTPSPDADDNLRAEGIDETRIDRVGNIMIDSLELARTQIETETLCTELGLAEGNYAVVTLHRPANVDSPESLMNVVARLIELAPRLPLIFVAHPRTRHRLEQYDLIKSINAVSGIRMIEPLGYIAFMSLIFRARCVITDSGGLQEETTYLDIPCLTLRDSTERPITITQGTNRLIQVERLESAVEAVLAGRWPHARRPELWDGCTADRILLSLARHIPSNVSPL